MTGKEWITTLSDLGTNVLEGTAREVKSGPITLSGSKQQIW